MGQETLSPSVVIPTWRRADWLAGCLKALAAQLTPPAEVLVVGRHDDPDARDVVQRWRRDRTFPVRWVEIEGPGHVAPVRRGLEVATGDVVAFLDDDAEPDSNWLAALVRPFENDRVACVGGRVVTPGFRGTVHRDAGRLRPYGKYVGNVGALEGRTSIAVDAVMEGNCAWRTAILRGLRFDPVLDYGDASMYGLDLCLQARERGFLIVYEPRARVLHHAAPRDPSLARSDRAPRTFVYSRNYTYIALKHLRGLRRATFVVWWWLVGERGSHGILKAAADLVLRGRTSARDIAASFAGKREGVRAWRGALL
jgi:GT2 family glycosyltransferase